MQSCCKTTHAINLYIAEQTPERSLDADERRTLAGLLTRLKAACTQFGLPVAAATLARLVDHPPERSGELALALGVVKDELASRLFLFVPTERAAYFEREVAWRATFPKAALDAIEAGNAFAAALYTACVFHCMRALERGLHALSVSVGVSPPRPLETQNWATIIDQIESMIRTKRSAPGATSADPDLRFWSEAATQFFVFKEAWRNQATHVRATYTENQAREILRAVDIFMAHLSTRLSE